MEFRATTAVESDPGTWYLRGQDKDGKPIRYRIRRLPGDVEQSLITDSLGSRKVAQSEAQSALFARTVARLRKRAVLALAETENVIVSLLDPAAAERLGAEPGATSLVMDAAWSDAKRDAFFRLFPPEQSWVNERLDDMAAIDREQEVEESKT